MQEEERTDRETMETSQTDAKDDLLATRHANSSLMLMSRSVILVAHKAISLITWNILGISRL